MGLEATCLYWFMNVRIELVREGDELVGERIKRVLLIKMFEVVGEIGLCWL